MSTRDWKNGLVDGELAEESSNSYQIGNSPRHIHEVGTDCSNPVGQLDPQALLGVQLLQLQQANNIASFPVGGLRTVPMHHMGFGVDKTAQADGIAREQNEDDAEHGDWADDMDVLPCEAYFVNDVVEGQGGDQSRALSLTNALNFSTNTNNESHGYPGLFSQLLISIHGRGRFIWDRFYVSLGHLTSTLRSTALLLLASDGELVQGSDTVSAMFTLVVWNSALM